MHLVRYSIPVSLCALLATACGGELEGIVDEEHESHASAFVAQDEELQASLSEEDGWQVTGSIGADEPFNRVGLRFDTAGEILLEGRVSYDDGATWGDWEEMTVTYHEGIAHNAQLDVEDGATHFQLRLMAPLETPISFLVIDLFDYVEPAPVDETDILQETGETEQGLATGRTAVVSRGAWGARATRCSSGSWPNKMSIHHTVTPNNDSASMPARMRQIQNYHMNNQGWCDVGYHFLIGQDGKVYQGRPERLLGTHVANANSNNAGISFIGTFTSVAPSAAMMNAGGRILKALSAEYGIALNRTKVKGHRQQGTTSTTCPGNALYNRLDSLINLAKGNPAGAPSGGFCSGKTGTWCDGNQKVVCANGSQTSRITCQHGCQSMPAGTPDQCKAPPPPATFCSGKTGTWCDGNQKVVCAAGVQTSRTTCQHGCQSMPAGTPDQCKAPPPPPPSGFCAGKTGTWCDGSQLVVCDNGAQASRTTCQHGCKGMPAGTPDQCEAPPATASTYSDIPADHWAHRIIEELRNRGALYGCSAGNFCPEEAISRADLAFAIAKLNGVGFNAPGAATFSDVGTNHWGFAAIEEVAGLNVIGGCGAGKFCPNDPVTRASGAVFVRRAKGYADHTPASPSFSDVPLNYWASKAIERMKLEGIVGGYGDGTYRPAANMTRAQAALVLARAYGI